MSRDLPTPPKLHGIRAVAEALQQESFPADKEQLNYAVGDIDLHVHGQTIPVRRLLDFVSEDKFETWEHAVAAIETATKKAA